jgi:DNA-directed RNA polymerase specialized sigma24 family protein
MSGHVEWTQRDWADLYPRLRLIAAGKLARLRWRGRRGGAIPGGKTAEDVVHDAIVKTISGERVWNQERDSLFKHLAGVISSDVNHSVTAVENTTTIQADDNVILFADHRDNPEATIIRKSEEQRFFAHLETKKPSLRTLAELILYDPAGNSTTELAAKMNLSRTDVESLKRALRRATAEFLKEDHAFTQRAGADRRDSAPNEQPNNTMTTGESYVS